MNMLLDRVPDTLNVAGTRYSINTDFRVWIRFEKLLTEENDNDDELLNSIFKLVFSDQIPSPEHFQEAVNEILWFYKCGKDISKKGVSGKKNVFSYDYDDGYIVAAFKEQYGINLNTEPLHWWEFHAYMLSLSENTEFVKIMGYRAVEITSKMPASQRNFYQKMKQHYKLPIKKDIQEKYDRIEEALLNGKSIDGLL